MPPTSASPTTIVTIMPTGDDFFFRKSKSSSPPPPPPSPSLSRKRGGSHASPDFELEGPSVFGSSFGVTARSSFVLSFRLSPAESRRSGPGQAGQYARFEEGSARSRTGTPR